jgi:acylphosphatase
VSADQLETAAVRAVVRGEVQGVGFRDATLRRARELGLMGWVRNGEESEVLVHAVEALPVNSPATEGGSRCGS